MVEGGEETMSGDGGSTNCTCIDDSVTASGVNGVVKEKNYVVKKKIRNIKDMI